VIPGWWFDPDTAAAFEAIAEAARHGRPRTAWARAVAATAPAEQLDQLDPHLLRAVRDHALAQGHANYAAVTQAMLERVTAHQAERATLPRVARAAQRARPPADGLAGDAERPPPAREARDGR
jgi:hypothetical protein